MVDEAKSAAGKKGAAIRAAKKKAAEENNAVVLDQYKIIVFPDGDIEDMTPGDMTGKAEDPTPPIEDVGATHGPSTEGADEAEEVPPETKAEEPPGNAKPGLYAVDIGGSFMIGERMQDGTYEHIARAKNQDIATELLSMIHAGHDVGNAIDFLQKSYGPSGITEGTVLAGEAYVDDADNFIPPEPARTTPPIIDDTAAVDKTAPALPDTILARANYYVEYNGLSEADALNLARMQLGEDTPVHPSGQPGAPGEGETLGPDKNMIAAYQDRMKTYVEPKLDVKITVENPEGDDWTFMMPLRFLDYLLRSSQWETIKRRREVNPADRLQMILREFRRDDQEVKLLMSPGSATGPAGTYNPITGAWSS